MFKVYQVIKLKPLKPYVSFSWDKKYMALAVKVHDYVWTKVQKDLEKY